ncbi:MAG: ABC transporter ATP-binding protein [Oscillospiraceae bacterium]|jgi:oligopeptide/dipeptide ABC transporter ATP-binding protein|nr:ABC transporter ATP-binding protein [Oscillospiraceae bacterium]
MDDTLIQVKNLQISFKYDGVMTPVIRGVSFDIKRGETLGMVGESGSGKSVTSREIMRLIATPPARIDSGEILFEGRDILKMSDDELRSIRGNRISMIFQEPMTSLNPVYTCGDQIMEVIRLHKGVSKKEARQMAIEMLREVGVQSPETRVDCYPHELSGGMRQRVMIAMALSCSPTLLISDEPTTALDPTIQAQILQLIKDMKKKLNMSVLFITHDLGVVAQNCDRVVVMYAGKIVEVAEVCELFDHPAHPYTQGLIMSIPKMSSDVEELYSIDGSIPSFGSLPGGCTFGPRCPYFTEECTKSEPVLKDIGGGHLCACHRRSSGTL